jgi:hypothetical protein
VHNKRASSSYYYYYTISRNNKKDELTLIPCAEIRTILIKYILVSSLARRVTDTNKKENFKPSSNIVVLLPFAISYYLAFSFSKQPNMVPPPSFINNTYFVPPEYLAALVAAQAQQVNTSFDNSTGFYHPSLSSQHRHKPTTCLTSRQQCLLFIKVLLRYLARAGIVSLQIKVKHVLAKCIQRNQRDKSIDLADLVEEEVRRCIGEIHWARAQRCYDKVCAKQGFQLTSATHIEAV